MGPLDEHRDRAPSDLENHSLRAHPAKWHLPGGDEPRRGDDRATPRRNSHVAGTYGRTIGGWPDAHGRRCRPHSDLMRGTLGIVRIVGMFGLIAATS